MCNALQLSVTRNTRLLRVVTPVSVSVFVPSQEKKKSMYGVYPHPTPHQEVPRSIPWVGRGNHTTLTPSASLRASRLQRGGVL